MSKPVIDLVSVIIPSYNSGGHIVEAVESVIGQTYENIEIIVVDDGSVDNTKFALLEYIDRKLVKYIYQENSGASAARNKGLSAASGRYIAFLDADDYWRKDKVEYQIAQMRRAHAAISLSNSVNVDEAGGFLSETDNLFSSNRGEMIRNIYLSKVRSITPSILIDRTLVPSECLYFNQDLKHREDSLFVLRIVERCGFCFLKQCLFFRREHSGSLRTTLNYKTTILSNFQFMRIAEREVKGLVVYRQQFKSAIFFSASKQALAQGDFQTARKMALISFRLSPSLKSLLMCLVAVFKFDFNMLKKLYRSLGVG